MSEVKTSPVEAKHIPEWDDFRKGERPSVGLVAGSFRVEGPDEDGDYDFYYCCPCGCGRIGMLFVGKGMKPTCSPSWQWNGSLEKPTLTPSVHHVGHWHGYLTDGVWVSC
ncbi:DUF6527 family protein [Mesorhizobium sp. GbtcB19]|uniref:DUF6527 family protein n=1 Tax=Mesorhizobium sp. GbtcB19 TaxID=2824764 RepID=UPI001C3018E8|nr:DUF6527 family protein [Mesorhizobium sp. GbtcB19]